MSSEHTPVMVYDWADPEKIAPPSEVCEACSDIAAGILVPVTFCDEAKAKLDPLPWETS